MNPFNRKNIIIALGVVLTLISGPAHARTVFLVVSSEDPYNQKIAAGFKKSFTGVFEETNLFGLEDRSRALGKTLSENPPRLMVAIGDLAAKSAKQYCPDCPVVYAAASNPEGLGLSGPNVNGISNLPSPAKLMENIRVVFPEVKNVGLVYQPKYVGKQAEQLRAAAAKAGLNLHAVAIGQMKEIPKAFEEISPKIDLLLLIEDPGVVTNDTLPFLFINCIKKKIPVFVSSEDLLKKCGVAGYGLDPEKLGADLAGLSSEVLAEKSPGGKVKSTSGMLVLNKKIAQMYNYNFPAQASSQGITIQ
jgi:putative ABC transport system substrate-binding protein